jgi:hypothetical protein
MHPDRMPSINLGLIVPTGATYDSHHTGTAAAAC